MPDRLLYIVPALLAIIALVLFGASLATGGAGALADPPCSNGTNWDNILQICR